MAPSLCCLIHHQQEGAQVAIPVLVPPVVVAVQAALVEVAEVQPVTVRVAGAFMPLAIRATTH